MINRYGSIALQSGELESSFVTGRIENLLHKIKECQTENWELLFLSANRNPKYTKDGLMQVLTGIFCVSNQQTRIFTARSILHDSKHSFNRRLECLKSLQDIGYQTGTGVMIGLPFQTMDDLAGDLLFMKEFDIDMCGMGPYIEHADTPLIKHAGNLMPLKERFDLTLKMIAIIRIMMKDINIVAATAFRLLIRLAGKKPSK